MALTLTRRPEHAFRDTALFRPRSLVLVGDPALPATAILAANIAQGGFKGMLHAVGVAPAGFAAVDAIAGLPRAPDLAVLSLPAAALEAACVALVALGTRAGLVTGEAPELTALCRRTGMRLLGDESFGLCVPAIGLNASLTHLAPAPGNVALVSQSGALARAVIDWAAGEAVGFSHVVGLGGNADFGFAPTLDWLARDAGTGLVLLDIRRIRNRRLFISAARAVSRTRPVVALRAGGMSADATGQHDAIMVAALRRAGVLAVDGLEDLLSAAETLARSRSARRRASAAQGGDRVAVVANGAGPAWLAEDALRKTGGRLAVLTEPAKVALSLLLPSGTAPGNPLLLPLPHEARLGEAAAALAALPEVDTVVALHAPSPSEDAGVTAQSLIAAAGVTRGAPVLVGWLGQAIAGAQRRLLAEAGTAVFATPEAAIRGAMHLAQDRRNRAAAAELPPREVLDVAPDRAAIRRLFDQARAEARLALTDAEALAVLAAYGVPTIPCRVAATPEEAAAAAGSLGFPAVIKVLSPDLLRKTEVGGVALDLPDAAAVRVAALAITQRVRQQRPQARLDGFLVQPMARRGHELRLRLHDDPMFGPWIGFGRGGTQADVVDDEAIDLPPLNHTLALALIRRTRQAPLLEGYRDWPRVELMAIADVLLRFSQLAVDFPEIAYAAINPLLADGRGVMALDAKVTLRPAGAAPGYFAIPPYPQELAHRWQAPDGTVLLIRPIRPEDAEAHREAFRRLDPEDVRWRFFSQLRDLGAEQVARLTQIDYEREMAFVAVESRPGQPDRTVGTARLVIEPGQRHGEFAMLVDPAWKGRGLGRHLMRQLIGWAREAGLEAMVGQVLADNQPMLAFVRSLGFVVRRMPEDEELREVRLELAAPDHKQS